jgi:threonyl-tRNA synthetase
MEYSKEVLNSLKISDIRAEIDERSEKTGRKIRDAEVRKIPFMLIVGEREAAEGTVSVRRHGGEDLGSMSLEGFKALVNKEITENIDDFVI